MVVDDEVLGRRKILRLLAEDPDLIVLGDVTSGPDAVRRITDERPDLLFLDIHMPGMDGFELLRAVSAAYTPTVIFVTAFDQHAVRAFEVHALDYLLKPFDRERFRDAVTRAKTHVRLQREGQLSQHLLALLADTPTAPVPASADAAAPEGPHRLMVKSNGRIAFLRAEEIDWIEAQGDYVRIHTPGKKYLVREKIGDLEERFSPARLIRIHRSTIVNADRIREMEPLFYGEYAVILHDGTRLTLSRSYRERVFDRLSGGDH